MRKQSNLPWFFNIVINITEQTAKIAVVLKLITAVFLIKLKKEAFMSNLARRNRDINPWRDFLNLDEFLGNNWAARSSQLPAVNISENEKCYNVEVVAPGFKKEDFKVKVDDDILTISAETKNETTEEGKNKEYTRREYSSSSFTRSF